MRTEYKGYTIIQHRSDSHTVEIIKDLVTVKWIAGDIAEDGSHNAIEKAKQYIDNLLINKAKI